MRQPGYAAPSGGPISLNAPGVAPEQDEIDLPPEGTPGMQAPGTRGPYLNAPSYPPRDRAAPYQDRSGAAPYQPQPLPRLGPAQGNPVAAFGPVAVKPVATLACPIVSVLDRWLADSVQPAAQRWFGARVVEIKQISAYSCRGMNGNSNAHISEHAFGNALDIAGFTLADGRHISVKDGWKGMPEEQGFLRDVQAAACQQFTTVLAPGSNAYHYDHIHVDLMRRASRRHDLPAGRGLRRGDRGARRTPQFLCLARTVRHRFTRRRQVAGAAAQAAQQGQRARRVRRRIGRGRGGRGVSDEMRRGHRHSITSSATLTRPSGMARPIALAALRLITNSNLVACMTGRSAGFSPLRIRPT